MAPFELDPQKRRSQVLMSYEIMDTQNESAFDDLVNLAADICGTPMACITFADDFRHWFKASKGTEYYEISLEDSFCSHVLEGDILIVPDARKDDRFAESRYVVQSPNICFYAGIKLTSAEGVPIGTLSVMDHQERTLDPTQIRSLKCIADQVMAQLELRRSLLTLAQERHTKRTLLAQAGIETWVIDLATSMVSADERLCHLFGVKFNSRSGVPLEEFQNAIHPDDRASLIKVDHASTEEGATGETQFRVVRPDGEIRWYFASAFTEFDANGVAVRIWGLTVDVTERQTAHTNVRRTKEQLRAVIDSMPALIGYWDTDLRNELANKAYTEVYGKTPTDLHGVHLADVLGDQVFEQNLPYLHLALEGIAQTFDRTTTNVEGGIQHSQITYIPNVESGQIKGIYSLVTDVTARREAELSLFAEKERARVTLSSIGDGVVTVDCEGFITYLNPKAEAVTGWSLEAAMGLPVECVMDLIDGKTKEPVINPIRFALQGDSEASTIQDCILRDLEGNEFGVEDSASPILDVGGATIGAVMVFHDVSEARAMVTKMTHLAQHDGLTNLPNRVLLQERLGQAIVTATETSQHFALVFLDLDHFKIINDTMGHAVGDELLRAISARISSSLRSTDTVSRQGGDEFLLLLNEVDSPESVGTVVQRIMRVVSAPYTVQVGAAEFKLNTTFSAGIAMYPDNGEDADTLMRRADTAMYLAKQAGRNQYHFFSTELDEAMMTRHTLLQDMREAIDNGEFFATYQPKVSTKDRSIVGVEALVRWKKPDGRIISPIEFIPLAEESGLIVDMGKNILYEACRQCLKWEQMGLSPIPVAVNVSAVQLASPDFVASVRAVLKETKIRPRQLELEITESSIMADVDKAATVLFQLKDLGVKISLDDFGTGYSSLSYIRRFPLDCLKIDRSFVSDLTTSSSTAAIMETICNLGKTLKLQIVAEGVEFEEQAELLCSLNCDSMQGYLFSKPVSGEAIADMLPAARPTLRVA